jgi:hypothetical protein
VLGSFEREMRARGCHIMIVSHWAQTVGKPDARLMVCKW